jgi:hypothetical protein
VNNMVVTFLVSSAVTISFWQFGLGSRMWPAHPFLAALAVAVACGIAIQLLYPRLSSSPK